MKQINKGDEPILFKNWKEANPNATYNDLVGEVKMSLKESLYREQKHLCCYCECRLRYTNNSSQVKDLNAHIEHFKPKGNRLYTHLQLDYHNLYLSCVKNVCLGDETQCGHKKRNDFTDTLLSSLEEDCSKHFEFLLNGEIKAVDERGQEAIDVYNLNSALLKEKRRALIDYFRQLDDDLELEEELEYHLNQDTEELGEFYTTINYLRIKNLI